MTQISQNVIEILTPSSPDDLTTKGYVDGYISERTDGLENIAELRIALLNLSNNTDHFYVKAHTTFGDGGGGIFDVKPIGSYVDDGGVVITDGYYAAIRRLNGNVVTPEMWGCPVGGNATTAINSAIDWCRAIGRGIVLLGARTYIVSSINLRGALSIILQGQGSSTVIEHLWGMLATYPMIDCIDSVTCTVRSLHLKPMAWTCYGIVLSRSASNTSCNGNIIEYITSESFWRGAPAVHCGGEVITWRSCSFTNAYPLGLSAFCITSNPDWLPLGLTSLYGSTPVSGGGYSCIDNKVVECRFSTGVGVDAKCVSILGWLDVAFQNCAFYTYDNITACKSLVYCIDYTAMRGLYSFTSCTFEGANTPAIYLDKSVGPAQNFFANFTIFGCTKTDPAAPWVESSGTECFAINWDFRDNSGSGDVNLGVVIGGEWDIVGNNQGPYASVLHTTTMTLDHYAVGSKIKAAHGFIVGPTDWNLGCSITYCNGDQLWDGSNCRAIQRSVLGDKWGQQLQILPSTKELHSDALIDGYGLVLHSDGTIWAPAGPVSEESYPVFRNSNNKWIPLTTVSATPATATSTGSKGTVAFDDGYIYICKNENDWGRVIVDSFGNTNLAVRTNQKDITPTAISLTSNSSTAILAVTISGLGVSKSYSGVVGARIIINTTGTPTNCGIIDVMAGVYISTNGSGVATVTVLGTVNVDNSKVAAVISTVTGTIAASTGGFSVYATRAAGITMKASAEANLISLIEIS